MLDFTIPMPLPDYVVADVMNHQFPSILVQPAALLKFPLAPDDVRDIKILERKFDGEKNCAGLAGPQIGIHKKIIIFSAIASPEMKQWRPDFTQEMPKTIWINPSYQPVGDEKHEDYEGCFSVKDVAGSVKRYRKIFYQAYDMQGNRIEGFAEGYLARIIQHETDHINGILFVDRAEKDSVMSIEAYREKRRRAMGQSG